MNDTQPQTTSVTEDARNRILTNALLALRHQTLMALLKKVPADFPERLDYGNASSWLRGVPGRFGVKKQRALLSLIGYADGHLRTDMTHVWYPPRRHLQLSANGQDAVSNENADVLTFFAELMAGGAQLRRRRVTTPEQAPLGWALDLMGATVLLPISNGISEADITGWFERQGLGKAASLCDETALARETWLDYIKGKDIRSDFWSDKVENTISPRWHEVIQAAESQGLQPSDLLTLIHRQRVANNDFDADEDIDALFKPGGRKRKS